MPCSCSWRMARGRSRRMIFRGVRSCQGCPARRLRNSVTPSIFLAGTHRKRSGPSCSASIPRGWVSVPSTCWRRRPRPTASSSWARGTPGTGPSKTSSTRRTPSGKRPGRSTPRRRAGSTPRGSPGGLGRPCAWPSTIPKPSRGSSAAGAFSPATAACPRPCPSRSMPPWARRISTSSSSTRRTGTWPRVGPCTGWRSSPGRTAGRPTSSCARGSSSSRCAPAGKGGSPPTRRG